MSVVSPDTALHVGFHSAGLFCGAEVCLVFSHIREPNYYANDCNYVSRGLSLCLESGTKGYEGLFRFASADLPHQLNIEEVNKTTAQPL